MKNLRLIFLIRSLVFPAVVSTATAKYRSENWTTETGLPQNTTTAILQSRSGYIWFGTFGGLVRFDGIKFKIFNTTNAPAIKSKLIKIRQADICLPDFQPYAGLKIRSDKTFPPICRFSDKNPTRLDN